MTTKTPRKGQSQGKPRQAPRPQDDFEVKPLDEAHDPFDDLTPEEIEQGRKDYDEAMRRYEAGEFAAEIAELRKNEKAILDNVMRRITAIRHQAMPRAGAAPPLRVKTDTQAAPNLNPTPAPESRPAADSPTDPLNRCRDDSARVSGSLASHEASRVKEQGRHVRIIDVTIREGLARVGGLTTVEERAGLAWRIAEIGVDGIELGTTWDPLDLRLVKAMTRLVLEHSGERAPLILTALCRCHGRNGDPPRDVADQIQHLHDAFRSGGATFDDPGAGAAVIPAIHLFAECSHQLRDITTHLNDDELIAEARGCVEKARAVGFREIQFSAMDGTRAPFAVLERVFRAVINAGATTVNIADTAGLATPAQITALVEALRAVIPELRDGRVLLSVHLHNALGMSTASAVAACAAGARQVEASINGIGPRGGNTALEEVVMALRVHGDHDQGLLRTTDLTTSVRADQLLWISQLVSSRTGEPVASSKPIVGRDQLIGDVGTDNAEVLSRDVAAFELKDIGGDSERKMVRGLTRQGFQDLLARHAVALNDEDFRDAYHRAREWILQRGGVEELELLALARPTQGRYWTLLGVTATSAGMEQLPLACARLRRGKHGEVREETATGPGPIAAIFRAIDRITGFSPKAVDFQVRSSSDITSHAQVTVVLGYLHQNQVQNFRGSGSAADILLASAQAYVDAVNQILHWLNQREARPAQTRAEVARAATPLPPALTTSPDAAREPGTEILPFDPTFRPVEPRPRPGSGPPGPSRR